MREGGGIVFKCATVLDHLQNKHDEMKVYGHFHGKNKPHGHILEPQLTMQLWWLRNHSTQQVNARTPGSTVLGAL